MLKEICVQNFLGGMKQNDVGNAAANSPSGGNKMNNFTFVKVKHKKFGFIYYALLIESLEDLTEWTNIFGVTIGEAYTRVKEKIRKGQHISDEHEMVVDNLLSTKILRDGGINKSKTFIDDILYLTDKIHSSKIDGILRGKKLIINYTGGWCFLNENYDVLETIKKRNCIFPDIKEKIRIIQWPSGKHYYAKIGKEDVIVDGKQKWKSYKEAKRNAEIFLKERS